MRRPEVTRLMGEKEKARAAMKKAGVPILPGSDGVLASEGEALEWARTVGFPVLGVASTHGMDKFEEANWRVPSLHPDEVQKVLPGLRMTR